MVFKVNWLQIIIVIMFCFCWARHHHFCFWETIIWNLFLFLHKFLLVFRPCSSLVTFSNSSHYIIVKMSDSKFLLLFAIFVFVMSFTSTTIGRKHRSRDCCCRPKKHCKNACEEEDDNEQTSPSPTPNEQICYINCYDGLTGTKTNNSVGVSYTGPYNSAICECGLSDYRCNASANGPLCGPFRDCRCYVGKMYAQCAFVQTPKQIQSVLIGCPHGRIPPPPQKIPPEPTPLPKSIYSYRCDWPGIGSMNYSPETATG